MIEEDRLISGIKASTQEDALERALRPKLLSEYVGQEKIRNQLSIFIEAARARKEPLDHTLLFGPPGLGADPPSMPISSPRRMRRRSICFRPRARL